MLVRDSVEGLRREVSVMARRVEAIFELAVSVLRQPEERLVREVRAMDQQIDALEIELDRTCQELLLKDPMAIDFRYTFSIVKTIKELERAGDQAKTIAKWAVRLQDPGNDELTALAAKAGEALRTAVEALIDDDVAAAERVMQLEFQVDALEDQIIERSKEIAEAFVAKALERVGDISTNIAENVIFSVEARDIRHGGFASARPLSSGIS